ncbi:MAG: SBBP repeat-containing protein [Bacteroidota bacterium]|nr:SBBP repeat-containing protein [Bacteroidota bacterium]
MKKTILLFAAILFYTFSYAGSISKPKSAQYGFIENKGQIIDQNNQPNKEVLYLYSSNGLQVQLRKGGFSYEMIKAASGSWPLGSGITQQNPKDKFQEPKTDTIYTHRIDISFLNANTNSNITAFDPAKDYLNYYTTGTHVSDVPVEQAGVTHVQHYKKVLYQNIYPNIDIEFVLNDGKQKGAFKYNFIIHPGGNINDIKLKFDGANNTSLTDDGNILIETVNGNIEESIPSSYQINEISKQQSVLVAYTRLSENTYGFNAKNINPNLILVVDPMGWATYCGSNGGSDAGNSVATDWLGNVYITGNTYSTSNIATTGTHQTSLNSSVDAFVVKFNSDGVLQWGTYYGGSWQEDGLGINIDTNLNILICGTTYSSTGIATSGAHQTTFGGGTGDAFIAKFGPFGTLYWATYYGGSLSDYAWSITSDKPYGYVMVAGNTYSTSGISTSGAFQTIKSGSEDAFIVKFDPYGVIVWGTYFGGSSPDRGYSIATDSYGNVIAAGYTGSATGIASTGAYQTTIGSNPDGFIVKFNSSGFRLWSTYVGGNGGDYLYGLTSNTSGDIFITGYTGSTSGISTSGAFQTTLTGTGSDAFIVKFNASGARLWGTYYGGNLGDYANGIAIDVLGNVYITGYTFSTSGIVTSGAYKTIYGGGTNDAFVAKFNSTGTSRLWGTYFGGSGDDIAYGIARGVLGNVFIVGKTASTSNIATTGSYQTTYGGGAYDIFLASFTPSGALPVKLISFDAKAIKENEAIKVKCNWSTASEINNNNFTIERSNDLENFEDIGIVKGAGNSVNTHYYEFTDQTPFGSATIPVKPKTLFYRLRQTDFDGTNTLSEIKAVEFGDLANDQIKLVYDKEQSVLQINSASAQKIAIQLYSLSGSLLASFTENIKEGSHMIPIQANVAAGFYLLKTQVGDEVQYFKVWMK